MMVRFFSAMGRAVPGMHEAAYLLAAFAFGSQLLALVRDRILAGSFGASHTLDIYYAAFRIPDFLFATVASLLSLYALLPVLSKLEANTGSSISFLRTVLMIFFAGMAAVCAVAFVCVPYIIDAVVPGLVHDGSSRADLILLTRILLLQPLFLGASNTVASLTQLRHRFVLYSISPLLYNIGIIFGAVVLYPHIGLAGLGWGVVLGAFLHLALQLPFFFAERSTVRVTFKEALPALGQVLTLSIPRTLALSAGQISLLIIVALASFLSAGSIAVFMFAFNLQAVPLAIIGVSYSVAAFPTLARLHAEGKKVEFAEHIETALRHMLFWAIPATVFVIVLRAQLVRVILGAGAFDWSATRLTAAALALFIIALAAQSISLLIARAYYAAGESRKPLLFGVIDVVVSVGSALGLVTLFHSSYVMRAFIEGILRVADIPGTTVLMLALGYALGSIVKCVISLAICKRDFGLMRGSLRRLSFQSFAASVLGGGITYTILSLTGATGTINTTIGLIAQGLVAGGLGLMTTAYVLYLLKNPELREAAGAFAKRMRKVEPIALEPTDVSS